MGFVAENSEFRKGRLDIIDDYETKYRTLLSGVAGRNFTKTPGFLYEAATFLELDAKKKLSDLNYKIVAAAIKRELAQITHDYDIAYREALIAFELNKQTLLSALEQEIADLKHAQALEEEQVNYQFIELEIRKLILITTKTEIEMDKESLLQELERVKRLTLPKEEELANQRLITVNKKLELIPYIEALIEKEYELLAAEETLIPYLEDEVESKQELVDKKEELFPYLEDKAEKLQELANAIRREVGYKEQIAAIRILKAGLRQDQIDNEMAIADAEIALKDLRLILMQGRFALQHLGLDWELGLTTEQVTKLRALIDDTKTTSITIDGYTVDIESDDRSTKSIIDAIRLARNEEKTDEEVDDEVWKLWKIGGMRRQGGYTGGGFKTNEEWETAEVMAAANITTNLMHILGTE